LIQRVVTLLYVESANFRGVASSSIYGKLFDIILDRYHHMPSLSGDLHFNLVLKVLNINLCFMVLKETSRTWGYMYEYFSAVNGVKMETVFLFFSA
jgi:hypothetical protein